MVLGMDHIAVIVSVEKSVDFYKRLGFKEVCRKDRGYDCVVILMGYSEKLEIYIDATHPPRVDKPEAMGLRHLALKVDNLEKTLKELKLEEFNVKVEPIKEVNGERWTFLKDPDGLPIELRE